MRIDKTLALVLLLSFLFGGCNYSVTSVAREDADVLRVDRPFRLSPTCFSGDSPKISKVELLDMGKKTVTVIHPQFNANGIFWKPTANLNGRYRFRFTCEGKKCYSPVFVVDGALNEAGKPIHYPRKETSSLE